MVVSSSLLDVLESGSRDGKRADRPKKLGLVLFPSQFGWRVCTDPTRIRNNVSFVVHCIYSSAGSLPRLLRPYDVLQTSYRLLSLQKVQDRARPCSE